MWGVARGGSIIYGLMRDLFAFVNDEAKVKSANCRQLAAAETGANDARDPLVWCSQKKLIKSAIKQQPRTTESEGNGGRRLWSIRS